MQVPRLALKRSLGMACTKSHLALSGSYLPSKEAKVGRQRSRTARDIEGFSCPRGKNGRGAGRNDCKVAGEWAESAFTCAAIERGFIVSKPYGDSAPYDFIVQRREASQRGRGRPLWRVQVKGVLHQQACGGYAITTCHGSRRPYTPQEIDFFVAWVAPLNVWYVIPVGEVGSAMAAGLYPHVKKTRSKYEKYRGAWELMG